MTEQTQVDLHKFGISDYLNGDEYEAETKVKIKVTEFLGRQEYQTRTGQTKRAGYYRVQGDNGYQQWRLGQKNEIFLHKKYGFIKYEDLVGKNILLQVKQYGLGRGFVVLEVTK